MKANEIVYSVRVGTMSVDGMDRPVGNLVRKVGRTWYVDRRVCNGVCHGGTVGFKTKAAAIRAADSFTR